MINLICMVYIGLVILYLIYLNKQLEFLDVIIIITSLVLLVVNLAKVNGVLDIKSFKGIGGYGTIEMYANNNSDKDYKNIEKLSFEEDFKEIVKIAVVYLTSNNELSYTDKTIDKKGGKRNISEWINVAYREPSENCNALNNKRFVFDTTPTFSRKNGLMFGSNRLMGPFCNNLGISLQSTFTIFFACKHGDFVKNDKEVELLKLYANSNDNNGLSLFIKANSIDIGNNTQTGRLMFKFVDSDEVTECLINSIDNSLTFDKLNLSIYFIIKEVDKIRILYMIGGLQTVYQLAVINIKETVATFSNKEMIINRFQNWKGSLYNFGVIETAVSDQNVTNIYQHCYSEYLKATNEDFLKLTGEYNFMLDYLQKFTSCPYGADVCKACLPVTKWNDMNQIMSAPVECKEAIGTFCRINSKHAMCKCWDTGSVSYKTDSCKAYRSIFDVSNRIYDNMTLDDVNYVRDKYNLIKPEDCPRSTPINCVNENLKKNSYIPYEFDKIKIKPKSLDLDEANIIDPQKIDSLYEVDVTSKEVEEQKNKVLGNEKKDIKKANIPATNSVEDTTSVKNEYREIKINQDAMKKYRTLESDGVYVKNLYQNDLDIDINKKINPTVPDQPKEKTPFVDKLINLFIPA